MSDQAPEFVQCSLADAVKQVEALLLAESQSRAENWNEIGIVLWYDGDLDKAAQAGNSSIGIRVAEVTFMRKPPNFDQGQLSGFCGATSGDTDSVGALATCAAAERAIMARTCYYEIDDEHQLWEVERADQMLIEACWSKEKR